MRRRKTIYEVKMKNIKLSDLVLRNQRFKSKIIEYFMSFKKKFFLVYYKNVRDKRRFTNNY